MPLTAVLVAACAQAAGSGSGASGSTHPSRSAAAQSPKAVASPSPTPWPVVLPVPTVQPGEPQTTDEPPASNPEFGAEMTDLWAGVASGQPQLAMPAFFPLAAYEQVKAIADPASDWQNRLVAEYAADVMAAHALLGGDGRAAQLVGITVPESEAGWITPGVCSNKLGYWHVANARLVYSINGQTRSFGISTLISWRGQWYVVHLGGELRASVGGMVDQPAIGPGTAGPPGGC